MKFNKDDTSILITGQAGQGIQTVETLLADLFMESGYHVFATKEYMSRVRGGSNSIQLRIASRPVRACIDRVDIMLLLDREIPERIACRASSSTLVMGEYSKIKKGIREKVDFVSIARETGNPVFSNTVATGCVLAVLNIGLAAASEHIKKAFSGKGNEVVEKNLSALKKGYDEGTRIRNKHALKGAQKIKGRRKEVLVNGTRAVALGAIAGGCNFISAYPMSPSTGVLTFLAEKSREKNITVEQAEDEISAINMVLGASYAGARGLVNTSGGGFALMEEGVSLAGMTEIPVVIHLAQRPGPATGLPTRTEQGDLNLALYSGHGEFPRIIFAPGGIEEAFTLTRKAFHLADRYQVPVFILTDQYFLDSYYNVPGTFEKSGLKNSRHIVKTKKGYRRYLLTEDGISPRGIPGYGSGFVCVDSDEHDENGRITEDMATRKRMVDKRWKKLALIEKDVIAPEFYGDVNYATLLISWGSTCHIVREALDNTGKKGIGHLHFSQVYPLSKDIKKYLAKAKKVVALENNYKGQFADLVRVETGYEIKRSIRKYNGLAFSVEEVESALNKELSRG